MLGYWENDSLMFMGKNGPTYGYNTTLVNYKKNYPDTAHMGQLAFTITRMQALNTDHYFIIGQFHLKRTVGDASGNFTLVFRKIKGVWKIISDHTS
jgi:ketosteroid isomerase-like protein